MKKLFGLDELMPSRDYMLKVDGEDVFVYSTSVGSFAVIESDKESVSVEVINHAVNPIFHAVVRPLSLGIVPVQQSDKGLLQNRSLYFELPVPARVSVELDGRIEMPLFLFAYKPELLPEGRDVEKTVRFTPGIHFAGEIVLEDDSTLIVEKGAWVHGNVEVKGNNVLICGRGVISGERYAMPTQSGTGVNVIHADESDNLVIRDVTLVDGPTWHLVPVGCRNLKIEGVNILGRVRSGDGIDICSCSEVYIGGCFVRVHDDCICLKGRRDVKYRDVCKLLAEKCVLFNWEGGNGIEIGYETMCSEIKDIVFRDIDIIHVIYEGLGSGGALTIHNGDRAHVHNVLYDDIRVEDDREKLIDIKMQNSTWCHDAQCGPVDDITFRNISVVEGGFPVSIIRGYDFNNMIHGIRFENLNILGHEIRNFEEAHMVCELASDVTFTEK